MTTLATLKNLNLSYPHKIIFKDAFFVLNEGDRIGVLGLNGHGKTSLFKILAETVTADISVPPFIFDKNKDFSLFLVPQELPFFSDPTIEHYILEYYPDMKEYQLRIEAIGDDLSHGRGDTDRLIDEQAALYEKLEKIGADQILNNYLSYLKLFGLTDLSRNISGLSGGEQRKVALSLGLSAPQKIILWDEPTNHLDIKTIEIFEQELMNSPKTFLVITHDRYLLNNVADRIVHIQHGKIKSFEGTYASYLTFLQEEEHKRAASIEKLSNYHRRETAWISRGAKARRTKSKKRIEDYDTLSNQIKDLKSLAHKSVNLDLKNSERKTKILIDAENLGFSYPNKPLFSGLNLTIKKGDKIALIGDNGQGKSTLLKIITGEIAPTSGKIKLADGLNAGFFSQKREQLDPEKTPWALIGEGIDYIISNTGEKRHVASYLENFLFTSEELRRPIKTFSGGEKNRLQLAQFMKHSADLWIFDEPTNDLDLETIGILEEELKNYEGSVIIVGHDRAFLENVTNTVWLLRDGTMEKFTAGYSQVESYLEALKLEEELKKLTPKQKEKNNEKNKLSYKDLKRLETIQSEIESVEQKVSELTKKYETEYSKEIESELEKTQSNLDQLLDEWAALEERNSLT